MKTTFCADFSDTPEGHPAFFLRHWEFAASCYADALEVYRKLRGGRPHYSVNVYELEPIL